MAENNVLEFKVGDYVVPSYNSNMKDKDRILKIVSLSPSDGVSVKYQGPTYQHIASMSNNYSKIKLGNFGHMKTNNENRFRYATVSDFNKMEAWLSDKEKGDLKFWLRKYLKEQKSKGVSLNAKEESFLSDLSVKDPPGIQFAPLTPPDIVSVLNELFNLKRFSLNTKDLFKSLDLPPPKIKSVKKEITIAEPVKDENKPIKIDIDIPSSVGISEIDFFDYFAGVVGVALSTVLVKPFFELSGKLLKSKSTKKLNGK